VLSPVAQWRVAHAHGVGSAHVHSACAAHGHAGRGLARLASAARNGDAARLPYGGDLTGARETVRESVAGLTGAWTAARHDGVDGGVG
jgi:hypothetical protein